MAKKRNRLFDADIRKLALCKVGANRQRIFLLKSGDGEETAVAATAQIIKEPGDEWTTAYVPVAVPGSPENPGMFGDADSEDVWEPQEIRRAAHRFMHNGGGVIAKHFDSEDAEGVKVVENAVALADFKVGDTIIKEGTWYVGVEFAPELRELVSKGEIDAVSVEGTALREPMAKYDPAKTGMALPTLNRSPKKNWVDRVGGFPKSNWIYRAAKHMHYEKGMTIGHAIAVAVNAAKKLCATGDVNWPGKQNAAAPAKADACKAVAEWEAMKARAKVSKTERDVDGVIALAKSVGIELDPEAIVATPEEVDAVLDAAREPGLMRQIAKALKLTAADDPVAVYADLAHVRDELAKVASTHGAMVALYPSEDVAKKLAVEGGESPDRLHLTLAFLGADATMLGSPDNALSCLRHIVRGSEPVVGTISGVGKFTAADEPVTYASVDAPTLPRLQQRVVAALDDTDTPARKEHGFTPHITLAYDDVDPEIESGQSIVFDSLTLRWGGQNYTLRFGSDQVVKGLPFEGANVFEQMDEAQINERFEAVEKIVKENSDAVAALTGDDGAVTKLTASIESLAKRLPEEEEKPPTNDELKEALAKVEKAIGDQLTPIAERIEALEEGEPSDTPDPDRVAKTGANGGSRDTDGILFD